MRPAIHRPFLTLLVVTLCSSSTLMSAAAQDSPESGVSVEAALDHGLGFGSEGTFGVLGADVRVYGESGFGGVLRLGLATQLFSNAFVMDAGLAYRLVLWEQEHMALSLAAAVGPSFAYGPFDGGDVHAVGGWAMTGLDFQHRRAFFGIGVAGHALVPGRPDQTPSFVGEGGARRDPVLALTPTLRVGLAWGR